VFVSYASKTDDTVYDTLEPALRGQQLTCWNYVIAPIKGHTSPHSTRATDQELNEGLQRRIGEASASIVIVSDGAMDSEICLRESDLLQQVAHPVIALITSRQHSREWPLSYQRLTDRASVVLRLVSPAQIDRAVSDCVNAVLEQLNLERIEPEEPLRHYPQFRALRAELDDAYHDDPDQLRSVWRGIRDRYHHLRDALLHNKHGDIEALIDEITMNEPSDRPAFWTRLIASIILLREAGGDQSHESTTRVLARAFELAVRALVAYTASTRADSALIENFEALRSPGSPAAEDFDHARSISRALLEDVCSIDASVADENAMAVIASCYYRLGEYATRGPRRRAFGLLAGIWYDASARRLRDAGISADSALEYHRLRTEVMLEAPPLTTSHQDSDGFVFGLAEPLPVKSQGDGARLRAMQACALAHRGMPKRAKMHWDSANDLAPPGRDLTLLYAACLARHAESLPRWRGKRLHRHALRLIENVTDD
jgi:hypothetical protein